MLVLPRLAPRTPSAPDAARDAGSGKRPPHAHALAAVTRRSSACRSRAYLGSVFSGYPVKYFGITLPAWAGKNAQAKELMSAAHLTLTWVLAGAVTLHLAGVVKHALIDDDGLVARMGIGRARPTSSPPAAPRSP
jgi:hypothetical protein